MREKAFTLVELLVVIAIIAILAAFLFPVFISARNAVYQMGGGQAIRQLGQASGLYAADADDTYPIALTWTGVGFQTWFGSQGADGKWDRSQGILSPYMKGKLAKDPTLVAKEYLGDESGMGYNYGVVGSDMHLPGSQTTFPFMQNAARSSEFENSSATIAFASTAYFSAPWFEGGDNQKYLFGFFDPPSFWSGVPNVDFRYMSQPVVDPQKQIYDLGGNAVFGRVDGSVKTMKRKEVKEEMFWRQASQVPQS